MRSNYKRIGDYVIQVKLRNSDGAISLLKGISINKHFMPSVANIIGTDLSKYRVVKKNQFAFNPMHVGRDEVLPISMLESDHSVIVSPAYVVFEVKDENDLLPEYLMMWCRRSEFDRNAWFMTDNSVRGGFSWADFCNMKMPIPSIEEQHEIVRQYNVLNSRITLNEELVQKLEDTSQTLYKKWFVDFEFPISKEYANSIGRLELEGKPYKSSGGEMRFCEVLDKDIPVGWNEISIGEILKSKGYIRGPFGSSLKKDDMVTTGIPVYEQQHAIHDHRDFRYYITQEKLRSLKRFQVQVNDFIISCSGTIGSVTLIREGDSLGVINQALLILRLNNEKCNNYIFKVFVESKNGKSKLIENSTGSAQINIAKREVVQSINLPLPDVLVQNKIGEIFKKLEDYHRILINENNQFSFLTDVLLSKMAKV